MERSRPVSRVARVGLLPLFLVGRTARPQSSRPHATGAPALPDPTDRVWVRADSAAAPATLEIFLHGGTLLMTSCGEPYQLARWQAAGDSAVSWDEGTRTIRAVVDAIADDSPTLRRAVVLDRREDPFMVSETIERLRKATVPFVCPDLPR